MRLYHVDEKAYERWQKKVYRLFRRNFSVRHEHYLLDDPEFMHDLLSVIEQKKMKRRAINIGSSIAELRRLYRKQSGFHRTMQLTEGSEHYVFYDDRPEREVVELRKGDDE